MNWCGIRLKKPGIGDRAGLLVSYFWRSTILHGFNFDNSEF